MDAFHSDDTSNDTQNLSHSYGLSAKASLNTSILGVAYSSEKKGIEENHGIFSYLDQKVFEASCGNFAEYEDNLDQLAREYKDSEEARYAVKEAARQYRGGLE